MTEIKPVKISHRFKFTDVDPTKMQAAQEMMERIGRQIMMQMCAIPDELLTKPRPAVDPLDVLRKFAHQRDFLEKRGIGRNWFVNVNPAALAHVVGYFDNHYADPMYPEPMTQERKAEIVLGRPVKIDEHVEWIVYRKPESD